MNNLQNQKNQKNQIKKLLDYLAFLLIVIAVSLVTYYYLEKNMSECVSEPFVYGAKQMEKNYNYEFYGIGYFITPINVKSPTITFNSTHLSWSNS